MQTETQAPPLHPIDRFIAERRATAPRFSKLDFADLVGVSRGAIYRVMTGDDAVSTELFEKIETATGCAISAVELFAAWKAIRDTARAATA